MYRAVNEYSPHITSAVSPVNQSFQIFPVNNSLSKKHLTLITGYILLMEKYYSRCFSEIRKGEMNAVWQISISTYYYYM